MQNFKPKKKKFHHDIYISMISITLKELHEFLHMMGAIIIFGENILKLIL
jgi:hypothetical protein